MTTEEQHVDEARLRDAGITVSGSLSVMMLDTKSTFDDLITRYASSVEVRDKILQNRLYQYIATSLAGTQEYMAMEKLYAIKKDPRWDLIVVDTPPTSNALDFLDAPERMIEALDSAVLRWLIAALQSSGRLSFNLLARGAAAALRGMARVTGQGFLEALAELVGLINELFGGFRQRADEVRKALRGSEVAYVLVTSPDPMSIREILYFADRLREQRMPRDALVVNRVHRAWHETAEPAAVRAELESNGVALGHDAEGRVIQAFRDEARFGALDRRHLAALKAIEEGGEPPLRVEIPAFAGDVHDIKTLSRVAAALVG
jgi:anion-transporting  ArsA/GET3 family ATPase